MIYIETGSEDVYYNFGLEYYFTLEKKLPDTVFLFWRITPTLMVGKYQNVLEEINLPYARQHGIHLVRRMSGGGTIYTDLGGWQYTFIQHTAERRIELLLETVGLRDAADKKMKKFSGGMLQRAGIAAAMLNDPQILILDEPTAGLDPCERVRFRNLIHSLSQDRIVILSTHIVSDIETIASKIVMLRDHRLYCCKTPQEVCGALRGKVFEVPSGTALNVPYQFFSERQSEHGTVLRIACETMPGGGTPVTPNLEDMFLYVYGEQEGTGHEPSAV